MRAVGVGTDDIADHAVEHALHDIMHIIVFQHIVALFIHDLTLFAQHIIILQQLLAHVKVVAFHALLRLRDRLGHHLGFDLLIAKLVEQSIELFTAETHHQRIFQRDIEAGEARIALTAASSAQLIVDTAGLMTFTAQYGQTTQRARFLAQLDIGTTAGHIGRDRHRADLSGLRDDLSLSRMVLRIQHLMRDMHLSEHAADQLTGLDRDRADQHRLPFLMQFLDLVCQCLELQLLGRKDRVRIVDARDRTVGRDLDDTHVIRGEELLFLSLRCTGHAGQLCVQTEKVLIRDGRQRGRLFLDRHAFLGFDGLMQTIRIRTAFHQTAGKLVDDDDLLIFADHIFHFILHDIVCTQSLRNMMDELCVFDIIQILDAEETLRGAHAVFTEHDLTGLLIDLISAADELLLSGALIHLIFRRLQPLDELIGLDIQVGRLLLAAGNDQRRTRFIDQDGVDLIDNCHPQRTLRTILDIRDHVVTQIVEAQLRVRRICDIAVIRRTLAGSDQLALVHADGQSEITVYLAHPGGVTFCQVLIDGDHMHAFLRQRVQIYAHRRSQRLTFTGLHLGDIALVHHDGTHDLHLVRILIQHPARCLTRHCKRLRQQAV